MPSINKEQLFQRREHKVWSQDQLAAAAGLSLRTVQRMENEGRASAESLKSVAAALQVPVQDFLVEVSKQAEIENDTAPAAKKTNNLKLAVLAFCGIGLFGYWSGQVVAERSAQQGTDQLSAVTLATEQSAPDDAVMWLSLVDQGDYAASWQHSAGSFQGQITEQKWISALNAVRKPLGDVATRTLISEQIVSSLPGLPDGEYTILVFATEFAHKKAAKETLSLAKEQGQLRPIGYFIQ